MKNKKFQICLYLIFALTVPNFWPFHNTYFRIQILHSLIKAHLRPTQNMVLKCWNLIFIEQYFVVPFKNPKTLKLLKKRTYHFERTYRWQQMRHPYIYASQLYKTVWGHIFFLYGTEDFQLVETLKFKKK